MKRAPKEDKFIIAHDPSFTAWGWSVIGTKGRIVNCGVIKTESKAKALRVRKGDDRVRRIKEINSTLLGLVEKYKPVYHVCELPHGSQQAAAAVMNGAVTAIIQTIADCTGTGVEFYSEADAKKSLFSSQKKVAKAEMMSKIESIYKVKYTGVKYRDEAVADSLAVFHVAKQQSEVLKFLFK